MIDIQSYFFYFLKFINIFLYLLIFKTIVDNISYKKFSNQFIYAFIFLLSMIIFIIKIKVSIAFILASLVFYKSSYKQSILKCIFISLFYWFIVYILFGCLNIGLVFNINYNDLTLDFNIHPKTFIIECMILQNILMIILFNMSNQLNKFKNFKNISKGNHFFMIIPILMNSIMIPCIFRVIAIDKVFSKFYLTILISVYILTIISKWNNFHMFEKIIYSYKLGYENQIIKDNILNEQNYYENIQKEKDKIRGLYHDIKNHMICIRSLCEDRNIEKVLEYLDSIKININIYHKLNNDFNTNNMILDSILRVKKSICVEKNIHLYVDVDFSKGNFIDMVDICTIFSNIIDNAIEACDKIHNIYTPKEIILKSKYIDGFCVILIENTKTNKIIQRKNLFLTSKTNSHMHGIGLNNVRNTVEKYLGEIIIYYSKNLFTVKILIPLKELDTKKSHYNLDI